MGDILLEIRGARKAFADVVALDDVSMRVRKGSIHGLLGENGAGKSTLMNILYGLYSPDSGEIYFDDTRTTIASPADGIALGIGMVHQVSTLVGEFTAVENIALIGGDHRWTLPHAEEAGRIDKLAKETGFSIPLDRKVKELSAGIKQKVEILRALRRGAKLLILDEPTTSLVDVTTGPASGKRGRGLSDVSFSLRGGEILGVAAVSGNGEKDLAELLFKIGRVISGDVLIAGKSVLGLGPTDVFAMGVSYTPEDRIQEGILPEASIVENVLLGHQAEKRFSVARTFVNWRAVREAAVRTISEYSVATPDVNLAVRRLSGGNIQKVTMGRAFVSNVALLVTHNPTSVVDISTVEFIYGKLAKMREEGGAILWIHEDVDELMLLCDRIVTIHEGRISGVFQRADFDKFKIGLAMIGGAA